MMMSLKASIGAGVCLLSFLLMDPVASFLPQLASSTFCVNKDMTPLQQRESAPVPADRIQRIATSASSTLPVSMAAVGQGEVMDTVGRKRVAIEKSNVPRGPAGSIKLTYLELNSWMWQVNGLNLLVDPVFGVLDFGVPALLKVRKRALWDAERVTRDLAAVTDCLVISQGFEDHCHPRTLRRLADSLDPSVRIVAPPSAKGVVEEHFSASRITYILPGEKAMISIKGRAVEIEATSGAVLGPPWQQAENGYLVGPAPVNGKEVRKGGSLYYEPHVMFNPAELSRKKADVVITPVVSQNIGPYALVAGGAKSLDLALTLGASKVVVMANGEGDFSGPLGNVVSKRGTLEEFEDMTRSNGIELVVPTAGEPVAVWP